MEYISAISPEGFAPRMARHTSTSVEDSAPVALNWYCLHTKPKRETQVASFCQSTLGFETYYPRLRQHRTIRRVRRLVTSPLFPRYLFCRFDFSAYRAVRFAPDVIDLVHVGETPATVPEGLIHELRSWAGDVMDATASSSGNLRPGDDVEIIEGPLQGMHATILRASDDRDRVAILLSILQCGAQMTLSRQHIIRADRLITKPQRAPF